MIFYILLSSIIAGIIAIFADVLIKQKVIQPLYEQQHMPKECIDYRKTNTHLIAVFLVGVIVYLLMFIFKVHKLIHFRNGF
jgi:hypothetical protein